jgi:hypothetical protein
MVPTVVWGVVCIPPPEQFAMPSASASGTIAPKRLLAENRTELTFS